MSFYEDTFLPLCVRAGKRPGTVASDLGYSRAMVSKWRSRGGRPSETTLMDLAAYFGLTLDEVVRPQKETVLQLQQQNIAAIPVYDLGAEFESRAAMRSAQAPRVSVLMSQLDAVEPGGWTGVCITNNDLYPRYMTGDFVIFQETRSVRPIYYGDPFAVLLDGTLQIGMFTPGRNKTLRFTRFNPAQAPITINPDDRDERLSVIGREYLLLRWNR